MERGWQRDVPAETRLVEAILRDVSIRLGLTYFLASVLSLALAIYVHRLYGTLSLPVEQALACVKLANGRKRRRAVARPPDQPNTCQQSTRHPSSTRQILTLTMDTDPLSSSSSLKLHRRELWGWLSYAFASEVFVIVSLTLFLPICLEQFARDNGFLLPDKTIPCSSSPAPPVGAIEEDEARCVVKLGWAWIDTASFRCVGIHLV